MRQYIVKLFVANIVVETVASIWFQLLASIRNKLTTWCLDEDNSTLVVVESPYHLFIDCSLLCGQDGFSACDDIVLLSDVIFHMMVFDAVGIHRPDWSWQTKVSQKVATAL